MKLNFSRRLVADGLLLLSFSLAVGSCRAASDTAIPGTTTQAPTTQGGSLFEQLKPLKTGVFGLDGVEFMVQHKSLAWAPAYQRDLAVAPGFPQESAATQVVKGTYKTDSGIYAYDQTIQQTGGESAAYTASLSGTPSKDTRLLYLVVNLPVDAYRGQSVYFDDKEYALPWWFKGQGLIKGLLPVKQLRLPLKSGGTLAIAGDMQATIEDDREYGAAGFNLEIAFSNHSGSVTESHLALTLSRLAATDPSALVYNHNAKQPPLPPPGVATPQKPQGDPKLMADSVARVTPLARLSLRGENFVDPQGKTVRFWGMNVVAFYPDYDMARHTADNLASVGVNMVRLHHDLRPSTDWAPKDSSALVTYEVDSRTPNLKAWDRFDYLNARLREKGIYLSVSMHGSRNYLPGDVAIKNVSPDDDAAWASAMDDLNHWTWKQAIDPRKMLPVFDERCFLLNAEFAKHFLSHINPYTGIAYGNDPQVATVELINEFSSEYTLSTGNKFPAYYTAKLQALLKAYAADHNVAPFDIYSRKTSAQQRCFSMFCNSLDQKYAERMDKVVRDCGYTGPIEFSNLWRGDANLRMRARHDGFIEDHAYLDPLVVKDPDNFLFDISKSEVAGKPLIIGEFNQSEDPRVITARQSVQSILPLAAAAYASLHNDAGILWFAWAHGTFKLNPDGWGKSPPNGAADAIGTLAGNSIMLDHLRSAGIIFKNGYLNSSSDPKTVAVDDSYSPSGYADLMRGQSALQPGWQSVHDFRKTFGSAPTGQSSAQWFKAPPTDPTVSDTGQITRDAKRGQLSFASPKAEGFSGALDGVAPGQLKVLEVDGENGFATVIAVTLDGSPLLASHKILVSKTDVDANGKERAISRISLRGLAPGSWTLNVTRPGDMAPVTIEVAEGGILPLPLTPWHECELSRQ